MIDFIDKLMKCMEYGYVFVIDFFKFDLQKYLLFYMRMNDLILQNGWVQIWYVDKKQ